MTTLVTLLRYVVALIRAERRYVRAQMDITAGSPVTKVVYVKRVVRWSPRDCE